MTKISYRKCTESDVPQIIEFVKDLAEYEGMLNEVTGTEALYKKWMFEEKKVSALFAEYDGTPVGFALYFYNFSTFLGKCGIYLEDLYVKKDYRGLGLGRGLFRELSKIAVTEGLGRLEWWCLDWNKPSIDFYRSLNAEPMSDWTVYRLSDKTLTDASK